jgi:serine/threonine protein kinase
MNAHVEELFYELADLSAEARTRYFAEHNVEISAREQVEALLAFDSGASRFLLREIGIAASRCLPQFEVTGRRCGPYRLLRVIGRGGMGTVYLAERADNKVNGHVAVKLLPIGADDSLKSRFLQEIQILAGLSHPNIAHMLDAGHLDSDEPFLVMEYINGQPINVFATGLSIREKIFLFIKVCRAAEYLHRNLVVHRDLKPSNILVTADGEPKLVDFGIAKLLDPPTDSTMTGMRMLTPDYASPEQVNGFKISSASDIYSLGTVLYLLLTGKSAQEFEDRSPGTIARVVTAREVTRPSRWKPELKGDLELILLKAMRKNPEERYTTAGQFAEDLQALLESRPVRARSDYAGYCVRNFLRRHWLLMATPAVVITSFSAGVAIASQNRKKITGPRRILSSDYAGNK